MGLGLRVLDLGLRGLGFKGLGFRVWDLGFRAQGFSGGLADFCKFRIVRMGSGT